jgi:molecular chaperone GrpE (heat shock protein)
MEPQTTSGLPPAILALSEKVKSAVELWKREQNLREENAAHLDEKASEQIKRLEAQIRDAKANAASKEAEIEKLISELSRVRSRALERSAVREHML